MTIFRLQLYFLLTPPKSKSLRDKMRYLADLEVANQADRDADDLADVDWPDEEAPPPISVAAVKLHQEAQ